MTEGHNLAINGDRLWDSLMEMAKIGATEKGGNCRLALTDLDREGRDLFVGWCRDAGCTIRIDKMGNIFARRAGAKDDLAPVMTGEWVEGRTEVIRATPRMVFCNASLLVNDSPVLRANGIMKIPSDRDDRFKMRSEPADR